MGPLNIGQGPFTVRYKGQEVQGIETVTPTTSQDTTDITTIGGQKITITKSHSAEVVLSFVDTGISNLKKIVPAAFLPTGTQIDGQPNGTVVSGSNGAIALGGDATGGTVDLVGPLEIVPSNDSANHALVLFDGKATVTSFSIADQVLKAEVTIRSEAAGVQLLKGGYTLVS